MSEAPPSGLELSGELEAQLLAMAIEASELAGAMLLERFQHARTGKITSKSTPTDLVSEADLEAERAIRTLLQSRRPGDGILGEEDEERLGESGLRWVVDPLDGTINFLFGIPHWCVSIAVGDSQGMLAGAIFDPCRGELFTARRGAAPTLRAPAMGDRPLVSSTRGELSSALVATGLAYDSSLRARQAQVLARLVPLVRDIRRFGSAALDLAWTAAGRYDAFFERGVKPWDIAAGALICEGAGLRVTELSERPGLPRGILAGSEALTAELLSLIET